MRLKHEPSSEPIQELYTEKAFEALQRLPGIADNFKQQFLEAPPTIPAPSSLLLSSLELRDTQVYEP